MSLSAYVPEVQCDCGMRATRIITAPIIVTATPLVCYDSPIDGSPVTSMAARRNDLAKHDCVPYDPELKKDQVRHQQENDVALDKSVDESVERSWEKMSTTARGKVASEIIDQGTTVNVERTAPKV